jgi:hypothetical protein
MPTRRSLSLFEFSFKAEAVWMVVFSLALAIIGFIMFLILYLLGLLR